MEDSGKSSGNGQKGFKKSWPKALAPRHSQGANSSVSGHKPEPGHNEKRDQPTAAGVGLQATPVQPAQTGNSPSVPEIKLPSVTEIQSMLAKQQAYLMSQQPPATTTTKRPAPAATTTERPVAKSEPAARPDDTSKSAKLEKDLSELQEKYNQLLALSRQQEEQLHATTGELTKSRRDLQVHQQNYQMLLIFSRGQTAQLDAARTYSAQLQQQHTQELAIGRRQTAEYDAQTKALANSQQHLQAQHEATKRELTRSRDEHTRLLNRESTDHMLTKAALAQLQGDFSTAQSELAKLQINHKNLSALHAQLLQAYEEIASTYSHHHQYSQAYFLAPPEVLQQNHQLQQRMYQYQELASSLDQKLGTAIRRIAELEQENVNLRAAATQTDTRPSSPSRRTPAHFRYANSPDATPDPSHQQPTAEATHTHRN